MTAVPPTEGQVALHLHWDGAQVKAARLQSQRPQPARMLRGQSLAQAAMLLPRVYSLCGDAQGVAVELLQRLLASGAAEDELSSGTECFHYGDWSGSDRMKDRIVAERVALETMREHLWRLTLDWPALVSLAPEPGPLRELMTGRGRFVEDPAAAAEWASKTLNTLWGTLEPGWDRSLERVEFDAWWRESPAPLAALLRVLQPQLVDLGASEFPAFADSGLADYVAAVAPRLRAETAFHLQPDWAGQVFEMGPGARLRSEVARLLDLPIPASSEVFGASRVGASTEGASTVTELRIRVDAWFRVLARLLELTQGLTRLRRQEPPLLACALWRNGDQAAVALEMARGVLLHWVAVDAGLRISDYRIVAPTEWNFHPDGPAQQGLLALTAADLEQLRAQVNRVVMALDPCVSYRLEIATD